MLESLPRIEVFGGGKWQNCSSTNITQNRVFVWIGQTGQKIRWVCMEFCNFCKVPIWTIFHRKLLNWVGQLFIHEHFSFNVQILNLINIRNSPQCPHVSAVGYRDIVIINQETIEGYFVDHHGLTFKEIFITKYVFNDRVKPRKRIIIIEFIYAKIILENQTRKLYSFLDINYQCLPKFFKRNISAVTAL